MQQLFNIMTTCSMQHHSTALCPQQVAPHAQHTPHSQGQALAGARQPGADAQPELRVRVQVGHSVVDELRLHLRRQETGAQRLSCALPSVTSEPAPVPRLLLMSCYKACTTQLCRALYIATSSKGARNAQASRRQAEWPAIHCICSFT